MPPNLAIVMATHNGEAYLRQQIESIQGQTVRTWRLWVSDDASEDATPGMLQQMAAGDSRIQCLPAHRGQPQGVVANFNRLFLHALAEGADYVFLADQDDLWLSEKMHQLLAAMETAETATSRDTPLLVHSDLSVIDAAGAHLHRSFMARQRLNPPAEDALGRLLLQNNVTGCAAMANAALLRAACPLPKDCPMHDWWLALVAAACGKVIYLPQALTLYRQHGRNQIGPVTWQRRLSQAKAVFGANGLLAEKCRLAGSLAAHLEDTPHLSPATKTRLQNFAQFSTRPLWQRPTAWRQLGLSHGHGLAGWLHLGAALLLSRSAGAKKPF